MMDLKDLKAVNAVGQIRTLGGEEVFTSANDGRTKQLSQLAGSFVETDQLCHSLKLGSVKKVLVINESEVTGGVVSASMQCKVHSHDGSALLTTAIGNNTEDAFVASGVLKGIAEKILQ